MFDNKRGFLKILEAIIALVVIFTFIVVMIPKSKAPVDTSEIPQELQSASDAIVKQLQSENEKRVQIIQGTDQEITTEIIDTIKSTLPVFSPWGYSFKIECYNSDNTGYCADSSETPNPLKTHIFSSGEIPPDKNVYPKILFITVEDVSENPPTNLDPALTGTIYKKLTIYFWDTTS